MGQAHRHLPDTRQDAAVDLRAVLRAHRIAPVVVPETEVLGPDHAAVEHGVPVVSRRSPRPKPLKIHLDRNTIFRATDVARNLGDGTSPADVIREALQFYLMAMAHAASTYDVSDADAENMTAGRLLELLVEGGGSPILNQDGQPMRRGRPKLVP